MKIVFVHQDGLMTGSAISLMNLIKGLKNMSLEMHVFLFKDGPLKNELIKMGLNVEVVPTHGFWTAPGGKTISRDFLNNIKALFPNLKLRKKIKILKPDILHINDKAALNSGISTIGLGIPIIQHLRSTYYPTKSTLGKLLSKIIINLYSDVLIGISEDEAIDFKKNAYIIHNSLNTTIEKVSEKKKCLIRNDIENKFIHVGWVGAFNYMKGAWDYFEMIKYLNRNHPEIKVKYHFVAKYPEENEFSEKRELKSLKINRLIKESGIDEDQYTFHGYRQDYLDYMQSFDLMICINRFGAFGRQAFESMACGAITIASHRYIGRSSIVINNKTGFVIEEGNVIKLAEKVAAIAKNFELYKHIGKDAQRYAKTNFDNELNAKKVYDIYSQLTKKK